MQLSGIAVRALHADHPVAGSQVCVPRHVPIALVFEQLRCAPIMPAVHEQLAVSGWQNMPPCTPVASAAQWEPVGQSACDVHVDPQRVSPSSVRQAPPGH